MLLGLGLATWMEFYTYDGVNLVLPDMAGTFGLSQDQASWILTVYLSCSAVQRAGIDLDGGPCRLSALHHRVDRPLCRGFGRLRPGAGFRDVARYCGRSKALPAAGLIMWWRASVYMLFAGPKRSSSLLRISVMLYLATSVGLLFCGYVTDIYSWRLIFLPNVVFAVVSIRLLVRHFPDMPRPADARTRDASTGGDPAARHRFGRAADRAQPRRYRRLVRLAEDPVARLDRRGFADPVRRLAAQPAEPAPLLAPAAGPQPQYAGGDFYRPAGRHHPFRQHLCLAGISAGVFPQPLSATQTGQIMCAYSLTAAALRPFVTPAIATLRPAQDDHFCLLHADRRDAARGPADDHGNAGITIMRSR